MITTLRSDCPSILLTMSLQDFLSQCHDETLDYIEDELLPKLIRIDRLNKMQHDVAALRSTIQEATK